MKYKKVEKKKEPGSREAAKKQNGQRHLRRRRRNHALFYVLLAVFIAGLGIYLSLTMFFTVEEIIVEGNTRYTDEELIDSVGVKLEDNLFKIDVDRAEDKLLSLYSYIEEAEVKRQFPTRVYIIVREAEPFAALEESDGYTLISSSGKVLERALGELPEGLMLVRGISTVLSSEEDLHRLELLREISLEMDKLEMKDYNFIDLTDTLDIVMICQNRLRIELGNELELSYKLQFVNEVVSGKVERDGFMRLDASQPGEVMTKKITVSPWDTITSQSPQVVTDDEEE